MRFNKTTAVGALAACTVVGATSPVWADSGSRATTDATAKAEAAEIAALKAEVAKLTAELRTDQAALHAATKAAAAESNALHAARSAAARWKAVARDAEAAAARDSAAAASPATPTDFTRARLTDRSGFPCHHDGVSGSDPSRYDSPDRGGYPGYDTRWHR